MQDDIMVRADRTTTYKDLKKASKTTGVEVKKLTAMLVSKYLPQLVRELQKFMKGK